MSIRYVTLNGQTHEISTESLRGLGEWGWDISQDVINNATGGSYNVKNELYGAKGDGVTDDTAAIQAAIDAAQDAITAGIYSKGTIYFPAGRYNVLGTLLIGCDNIHLLGDGPVITTIGPVSQPTSPNTSVLKFQRNASYQATSPFYTSFHTIKDLSFISDQWGNTKYVSEFIGPQGLFVDNCRFAGGLSAVFIDGSIHTAFKDCAMQQGLGAGSGAGIKISDASATPTTTNFYNCYIQGNRTGYRGGGSSGTAFFGCIFEANTNAGLEVGEGSDHNDVVHMFGCHFENNKNYIIAGSDAGSGGNHEFSYIRSENCTYLPGALTTGTYAFDLGNVSFTSMNDYVVPGGVGKYTFRVNRGGTTFTKMVNIGSMPYQNRSGYGEGTALQTGFAVNEGTDSPFTGNIGTPTTRLKVLSGASITPNPINDGETITVTLTQNLTINAPVIGTSPDTAPIVGQKLQFLFTQDGTGGRTVTWNAVFKTTYVNSGNTAAARCAVSFVYDGTAWNQSSITEWTGFVGGLFNVQSYGAKGDGSTDDTTAIQAAIDACKNGIVYFPKGTYRLTAGLTIGGTNGTGASGLYDPIHDNLWLVGESQQSVLKWDSSFHGTCVDFSPASGKLRFGCGIRELTIQGQYTANVLVRTRAAIGFEASRCLLTGGATGTGISLDWGQVSGQYSADIKINKCYFQGNKFGVKGDFYESSTINRVLAVAITENFFIGTGTADGSIGVTTPTNGGWTVSNNTDVENWQYGVWAGGNTSIVGNRFEAIGTADVYIDDTTGAYGVSVGPNEWSSAGVRLPTADTALTRTTVMGTLVHDRLSGTLDLYATGLDGHGPQLNRFNENISATAVVKENVWRSGDTNTFGETTSAAEFNLGTDQTAKLGTTASKTLSLYTNNTERVNVGTGGGVGIGGAAPASAKLSATSTTQGFLPPVMTTTQKNAISSPAEGLVVYDSSLHKLCVYTGGGWETVTSA